MKYICPSILNIIPLELSSKWYYMDANGVMACNETLTINGKTYKFSSTGAWIR